MYFVFIRNPPVMIKNAKIACKTVEAALILSQTHPIQNDKA